MLTLICTIYEFILKKQNKKNEAEEEGWTILPKEASEKHIYPTLPESETSRANPMKDANHVLDTVAPQLDVKIEMQEMGFSNERGWLTKLLEAKAGDVGQSMKVMKIQK